MKTLLTLLASTLVFSSSFAATAARPNIVFILADDLGWKDVGYAASSFYRTPSIDRLARGGMRFYNDETGRYLLYNLAEDPFEQHDLSAAMLDQARTLDERLTRLLDDMKARMPRKNPAFDPKAERLMSRRFTLGLATKEREAHAARIKAAGLNQRHGTKAGSPP
jgi:hypothetical protein